MSRSRGEVVPAAVAERGGRRLPAMAGRGSGSSEHLERLHDIFQALHRDLRGVPERLRGSAAGEAGPGGGSSLCCGRASRCAGSALGLSGGALRGVWGVSLRINLV